MRAKKKGKKWRFFWKNFGNMGRLLRLATGAGLMAAASAIKEEDEFWALLLAAWAGAFFFDAIMKWSPYRALLRWPTRKAFLRHYPEGA